MNSLQIDGGVQKIVDENGNAKSVNPGTSTLLSFNAMFALVIASTTGAYRCSEIQAGIVAYHAYYNLLRCHIKDDVPFGPEDGDGLLFADIPVRQRDEVADDSMIAVDTDRGVAKYRNQRIPPFQLAQLSGITG